MRTRDHRNVLAVYSLLTFTGREHFAGILDALSNRSSWRLSTVGPERFQSCDALLNEKGEPYDGFILSMAGSDEVMAKIAELRTPTVLVDIGDRRLSARSEAVASVWTDNADIGRLAARHFLEQGQFASAGFVHMMDFGFFSHERMMSFRRTMKGGGYDTSVFPNDGDFSDFFARLRAWVKALPKPAAVMAATDERAADVINACRAEGICVPAQVSVVGVDHDIAQHAKCGMSISSVVINSREMGQSAANELEFLFRHPRWRGRRHEVLVPAKGVFVGESTALSASVTHLVDDALAFIAENCGRNLSPDDVSAHLGCSRRLADMRFAQVCGLTVSKAIADARMDEVRRRLREGGSVGGIAKAMEFASANLLSRMYKRHFGRTISSDMKL